MILDNLSPRYCIPVRIGNGPSLSGPRIGGAPPEGVSSTRLEEAHYLLTLALEDDDSAEVSLFLNRDWWDFFFDQIRIVSSQDEPWIEFVVHGPSVRSMNDRRRHLLTPYPLTFGLAILDQQGYDDEDNEVIPMSDHKMGGRPYLIKSAPDFVNAIQEIERSGYRQLFQLSFPGSKDADISGDWPFGDGIFNLFFKYDEGQYHWYYCWQY